MGMDCFGKNPTDEAGKYFRNNVWWWRPLADLVCELAPEEAAPCKHWHTNDGDGLNKRESIRLANKLDVLLLDGTVARYIEDREKRLSAMPRETCLICYGTGIRIDDIGEKAGMPDKIVVIGEDDEKGNPRVGLKGWCNGCNGWGTSMPHESWYHLELDNVKEFADFVRASGGFEIC